ncbi:protein crumbs homolog 2-like [Thalassophryne amazonica]|uniref:protein crumbs homolog 2-like n=1 Tax=Thalassophryne amazonica TaxID=390379 RepID=UPI0014718BF9|nr:protein crumbs homolog 2-like [Thalassophryne amazonica]
MPVPFRLTRHISRSCDWWRRVNCKCYEGHNCETDINECAEQPCENGGKCFERSDPAYLEMKWELSFADGAGYICRCQPGFAGENCSVNIDECESEPCQNGATCEDQINGYTCTCSVGFLGDLCDTNIDECESQPCQHGGWCEDSRASYTCHCPHAPPGELPWGGDHCNVKLYGCVGQKCHNGATCRPWLKDGKHQHTCLCPHGFYDEQCSTGTTFSFSTAGYVHIEVDVEKKAQRELEHHFPHIFGVQLRFRTTIPNLVLFYRGDMDNHFFLEIVDGGLHGRAFSEECELDITFPDLVSDGDWWEAHVFLNNEGLVLIVKGPGCNMDRCKVIDGGLGEVPFQPSEDFHHVYIGGAPDDLLRYTKSKAGFTGCMEDMRIDSEFILPQKFPKGQEHELGCSKTEWCKPDPCFGNGRCVDLWKHYCCECYRPFYSESCSEEFPLWTFGHEDALSFSVYNIVQSLGNSFNLSFFLRSLKPYGLLFQLRRPTAKEQGEVYFSVYLWMGRVFVSTSPNSAPLTAPIFVTNGEKQLLQVQVRHREVIFEHAGLRYGMGDIPDVNVTVRDQAYVGGLPENWDSSVWGGHFKGCLQDFRLNTVHLDVDVWTGQDEAEIHLPTSAVSVMKGCISDNTCKMKPCLNGADCTITFNDFSCSCLEEYTGKMCERRVWCSSHPCVNAGHCVDLPDGYECVYNATFENSPVVFSAGGTLTGPVTVIYMELRTRSENAVLLRSSWGSDFLMVGLLDSSVRVEIHSSNSMETLAFTGVRQVADGSWHRLTISKAEKDSKASPWVITVDGITDTSSVPELSRSVSFLMQKAAVLSLGESFTGCLGAVRVGGVYLPFVDDYKAPQLAQFHVVGKAEITLGCTSEPVCDSDPCLNGATCQDLFNQFGCVCESGWEGQQCEVDTDDCASQPCVYGACKDFLAGFECQCHPGYTGTLCDEDVDECKHNPCEHGGMCHDGPNMFTCTCPKDYSGPRCQWDYPPKRCGEDVQCANEGVCADGLWGANCTCMAGFTGSR